MHLLQSDNSFYSHMNLLVFFPNLNSKDFKSKNLFLIQFFNKNIWNYNCGSIDALYPEYHNVIIIMST